MITVGLITGSRQNQQKHMANKATYITSAPLVLAYALAGNIKFDLERDQIKTKDGRISIVDIWPSREQVEQIEDQAIMRKIYQNMAQHIQVIIILVINVVNVSDSLETIHFSRKEILSGNY